MDTKPIKSQTFMWENIRALMIHRTGDFSYGRLSKQTGIAKSTLQKSAEQGAATGLKIIEQIADSFQLEVWQLLIPGLEPDNLPVYMSKTQKSFLEKIKNAYAELK